ncbi:MAG: GntR family transcriptional regulator, partial [Chloroflexota bacterium]|nr:GntR family transcriptional regulator [Chloroflexota bacterium]
PSSTLPSEIELTSLLEVSRPTVRHALQLLTEEGLVERRPGRGTFVTGSKRRPPHKRTGTLALVGPEMRDSFLMRITTGAEHVVSQNDYHLILCNAGNQICNEQKYLRDLWEEEKVDGFIIMPADAPEPHQTLRLLLQDDAPMVFVDRYFEDLAVPFVVSDNLRGGYLVTKHLIDLGHRQIGFVTRPNLYVSSVAQRLQGYRQALEEAGLEYNSSFVFQGLLPYLSEIQVLEEPSPRLTEYDKAAIHEFLTRKDRPSAIVACNEIIAAQVMDVCRELNLRIPQDIAVVGYDDDTLATLLTPPLTTVRQQTLELGASAARILLDLLDGNPVEQGVFLPVQLVVRQSCGVGL